MNDSPTPSFLEFLISCYILNEFFHSDIHHQIAKWFEDTNDENKRTFMVWRGFGKSFIICAYAVWRLLRDPNDTIIFVSANTDLARQNLELCRRLIEENPFCEKLRGGETWNKQQFIVPRSKALRDPSVKCVGLDGNITGLHCELLILDDVEVAKHGGSDKERDNLDAVLREANAVSNKQRLSVGTPHAKPSILTGQINAGWNALRIPLHDENRIFAWNNHPNKRFNAEWLAELKSDPAVTEAWVKSQYFLEDAVVGDQEFDVEFLREYDEELSQRIIRMPVGMEDVQLVTIGTKRITSFGAYWDWSTGKAGADNSVFGIVVQDEENDLFIHHLEHLPEISLTEGYLPQTRRIIATCIRYGINLIGVEEAGASAFSAEIHRACQEAGVTIATKPIRRSTRKEVFISRHIENPLHGGRLHIHKTANENTDFTKELTAFPRGNHDDNIDCVAGCISMIQSHHIEMNGNFIQSNMSGSGIHEMPIESAGKRLWR